jgi:CRP/FNR family transcriptional regulator, cyclic AMP receptor protein
MLPQDAKMALLRRVPLFEACSKRELREIASIADELQLAAGARLAVEGAAGHEFVVVVEGAAEVRRGGRKINTLGNGDFLGEIALITGGRRTATVTTLVPTRLLLIAERDFKSVLRDVPSLQPKIMQALAVRLESDD